MCRAQMQDFTKSSWVVLEVMDECTHHHHCVFILCNFCKVQAWFNFGDKRKNDGSRTDWSSVIFRWNNLIEVM